MYVHDEFAMSSWKFFAVAMKKKVEKQRIFLLSETNLIFHSRKHLPVTVVAESSFNILKQAENIKTKNSWEISAVVCVSQNDYPAFVNVVIA